MLASACRPPQPFCLCKKDNRLAGKARWQALPPLPAAPASSRGSLRVAKLPGWMRRVGHARPPVAAPYCLPRASVWSATHRNAWLYVEGAVAGEAPGQAVPGAVVPHRVPGAVPEGGGDVRVGGRLGGAASAVLSQQLQPIPSLKQHRDPTQAPPHNHQPLPSQYAHIQKEGSMQRAPTLGGSLGQSPSRSRRAAAAAWGSRSTQRRASWWPGSR